MSRFRLLLLLAGALAAITLIGALPGGGASPAAAQRDLNCSDFPNQAAAQANLRANPSDPNRLDADRDGVACESSRCPCDRVPVNRSGLPAVAPAPVQPAPAPIAQPAAPRFVAAADGWTRVTNIVDGDTVDVLAPGGVARVRFYGIDAPESGTGCGQPATDALYRLLTDNGRDFNVYLEFGPRQVDQFGRALAYVWVADGDTWYLIDEWMVLFGYARAWREDGQHRGIIIQREEEAAATRSGCLWG